MNQVKSFLMLIIALSVFLGIVHMIIPKKTMGAPLRLIAGLIMLITIVSPFTKAFNLISMGSFPVPAISVAADLREYENNYKNQVMLIAADSIKAEIDEYFLNNYEKPASRVDVQMSEDQNNSYSVKRIIIYTNTSGKAVDDIKKHIENTYKPEVLEIRSG